MSICGIILIAQDPPKKKVRKEIKRNTVVVVIDTVTVSTAERAADEIYLEQKKVMNELDSLNKKK